MTLGGCSLITGPKTAGHLGFGDHLNPGIPLERGHQLSPVDLVVVAQSDRDGAFGHTSFIDRSPLQPYPAPLNSSYGCLRLTSMFLERGCPACRTRITARSSSSDLAGVCASCVDQLAPPPMRTISGFDKVMAVAEYDPVMASIIRAIKRGERPELLKSLAVPLARLLRPCLRDSTVLTWVPASSRGRRLRGFDQGRLLAEAVGRELRIDRRPAFRRSGSAQRGADRAERIRGPRLHLRPDWARRPPTAQVIIVDDVITTGSSLAVAAATFGQRRPREMIAGAIASRP